MDTEAHLVTIGLPVYNGEAYLRQAIESILEQTHHNLELIISDNASTDGTAAICEEFTNRDSRVRMSRQAVNRGAAFNFNFVLTEARGAFFKWMAHDDVCRPRFIEACLDVLLQDSDVVVAYPTPVDIDASGEELQVRDSGLGFDVSDPTERFRRTMKRAHKNLLLFGLMRTEALIQTGKHGSYHGADRVLMAEMALRGKLVEVPEPLLLHREHPDRYVHLHQTVEAQMEWHDPSRASTLNLPMWLRLQGYIRAIKRSPVTYPQRAACLFWMFRWAIDLRRELLSDLKYAVGYVSRKIAQRPSR